MRTRTAHTNAPDPVDLGGTTDLDRPNSARTNSALGAQGTSVPGFRPSLSVGWPGCRFHQAMRTGPLFAGAAGTGGGGERILRFAGAGKQSQAGLTRLPSPRNAGVSGGTRSPPPSSAGDVRPLAGVLSARMRRSPDAFPVPLPLSTRFRAAGHYRAAGGGGVADTGAERGGNLYAFSYRRGGADRAVHRDRAGAARPPGHGDRSRSRAGPRPVAGPQGRDAVPSPAPFPSASRRCAAG